MSLRSVLTRRSTVCHLLAVLITIYGALLRLHCFVEQYGPLDRPAWARVATRSIAPRVAAVAPTFHWTRQPNPYVGGDPITYIEYGRSMTSFYQGHVREPVFLAMTHAGIRALDDQDAGVSLASATGSTLMIYAAYLVGAAVLSPAAGLIAALLAATEIEIVTWAVDGWRDDTFAAAILFSCWALLRLRARPSFAWAIAAGILCGLACLTRITAITFVVPALAWVAIDGDRGQRGPRLQMTTLAALITVVVVAPYLISCAIAYGDPLIAINYHTGYYRFAENRPIDQPMSAAEYLRGKFAARPLAMLDTGLFGLFVQPFITKWHGFGPWLEGLGAALRAISLAGLAALPFFAAGRLVLVVLLGSLVPYMFTWNVGGGGAWRFTLAAYPIYFVAVGIALVGAVRGIRAVRARGNGVAHSGGGDRRRTGRPLVRGNAVVCGA
jgi:4-amino-4-deoxy-L-arabinose transferase-like glycosyltransferase